MVPTAPSSNGALLRSENALKGAGFVFIAGVISRFLPQNNS